MVGLLRWVADALHVVVEVDWDVEALFVLEAEVEVELVHVLSDP